MPRRPRRRDQDGIYQRPDSPYWWATWTDANGRTARRSTGIRRQDDPGQERARAVRAGWVVDASDERRHGPARNAPDGPTFDDLMMVYMDGPSVEKRAHERDLYSLKRLATVFMGRPLADISVADARGYVSQRQIDGAAPATINRELGLFSAALNWARREMEWDVSNPFEGRRMREPAGRDRWLSREEADALIAAAEKSPKAPHLPDFIRLSLATGMRSGELLRLEWNRVDFGAGLIYLGAAHQKSGKAGSVPMNNKAREAMLSRARFRAEWCPASPWVFATHAGERIASIKRSFATAARVAGLSDVHPHDLRRTFGSWLVQSGVPIQAVSALLRHSDIRVTAEIYAHLSPDSLREAISVLDRPSPVSRSGFTLPEPPEKDAASY